MRHAARAIVIKDDQLLVMHRNKFGQEFCALIGGGVDFGETPEQALYREVKEETGIEITNHRLVIVEDAGEMYGVQYIYVCDYVSGEPVLAADSIEAQISMAGQNIYTPGWIPVGELPKMNLLPVELKDTLVDMIKNGWPSEPLSLVVRA
jgi:8-oxo-dGTP diphosphatase